MAFKHKESVEIWEKRTFHCTIRSELSRKCMRFRFPFRSILNDSHYYIEKEGYIMNCKKASLVINPRTGENVAKITDVLAVLAAAGWKTGIALKEYGGHSLKLAQQASEDKSDLIIAYGGDGTLNQVVNGVMTTKKSRSTVGVIPGGTANVWAGEVGIPVDPVKAALSLVNSEARKVDVGHIEVKGLSYAEDAAQEAPKTNEKKKKKQAVQESSKAKHHFLLMAGLGIDAAIMQGVSKPLKYRVGTLAVGLAAAKSLPAQHAFPIEVRSAGEGREGEELWKGEALQVVIGNTRRYADITEMTPNAFIDDGILDVCVITGGDPLGTMQQIASLLLRRKPDNTTAEYFHDAHLEITVPASVPLQLDGSVVKLKDYINKADYTQLQQAEAMEHTMVTYRFDAMPRALEIAIPQTYNYELFEHTDEHENVQQEDAAREQEYVKAGVKTHSHNGEGETKTAQQEHAVAVESRPTHDHNGNSSEEGKQELPELVDKLLEEGRKVTVVGKAPVAGKKATYIIAGGTLKASTGETRPVAVVVNDKTTIYNHQGEKLSMQSMEELQEGAAIIVEGDKNKRGVIGATRLIV
jgi:YegS/Rv2252/BmrU family lipid kinase